MDFSRRPMNQENPYAPPTIASAPIGGQSNQPFPFVTDSADRMILKEVIRDAGQFWVAIALCLSCSAIALGNSCSAIGAFIIPFWYLARLLQWNRLAKQYPDLMLRGAPPGSIQAKFQSSQWKLIVGMIAGACIFAPFVFYIILLIVSGAFAS
ncbi:MAG: hypothetical protein JNK57_13275 [Planctomycetaceae bacterium]|nr:hypothetical protein [Planctomycetaceae bacterium]